MSTREMTLEELPVMCHLLTQEKCSITCEWSILLLFTIQFSIFYAKRRQYANCADLNSMTL